MAELHLLASALDLTRRTAASIRRGPRKLRPVLVPSSAATPSTSPGKQVEGDVVELGSDAQIAHAGVDLLARRRRGPTAGRAPAFESPRRASARRFLLGAGACRRRRPSPRRAARWRGRRAPNLEQAVRDEDDGAAALPWRRTTSSTRSARFAGSAALIVEQQHIGLDGERACEVENTEEGGAEYCAPFAGRVGKPNSRTQSGRLDRRCGEAGVGGQVEIGNEGRFLIHRDQPGTAGSAGEWMLLGFPRMRICPHRPMPPVNLHQRRLAGAVGPHQA